MPEDYLASLVSIAATVHVPASWLGSSDAVLCSWSLAGWGECTSLAIAEDAEAAVPVLDLSLLVPADEDADVEFYLSVDATTRQESLVKLGSVPVAQLKASEGAVDITAAAESVDQLVEANAGSGRDMDLVSIGKNSG